MKIRNNQSGTGVLEALLILVIVGILGFTGWFVWSSQKSANDTYNNTDKSDALTAAEGKAKADNSSAATNSKLIKADYLVVKEWGVKIPIDESLSGLVYTYERFEDGRYLPAFNFESILGGAECGGPGAVAYMIRFRANETSSITGELLTATYTGAVRIGDYFYAASLPQAACSNNQAIQSKINDARGPISKAIEAVQPN